MAKKERLDLLLTERGLCKSREKAKREIMAGNVYVSGQLKDKPGKKVSTDSEVTVKRDKKRYVSRGGKKLEAALEDFALDVKGFNVLDIGASTGGFTDCLLRKGAKKVWALDVGKGQLDWNLRQDDRVTPIEGKNARYLEPEEIGIELDLVTIDVSFISLELILPNARKLLLPGGKIITLVKPQFEAGPEKVEKGGVVTNPEIHKEVLEKVAEFASSENLSVEDCNFSPIQGKSSGNIEYFFLLSRSGNGLKPEEITGVVDSAHDYFS
ncbi:TlyA family RNA methyltransferase [Candidatus Bipolaricaulota bacterium]|nr:TlyA family RNA methyltransferase [Candidatus Bipolaricaulota bacterium]